MAESNDEEIKKLIKEYLSLDKSTPELMKILINKIEVHQNKEIDIYFNFKKLNEVKKNYTLN